MILKQIFLVAAMLAAFGGLTTQGVLKCTGCGKETMTETQKDEKLKSKHGKKGKNKPFIYSYDPRMKPKTFYEEDCAIAGGQITSEIEN